MKNFARKTGVLLTVLAVAFAVQTSRAQDPVKAAPHIYKVLLENVLVRVLEIRLGPGGKSPMHSHPAYIVYGLGDGKTKFTLPGGKTRTATLKNGQAFWSEAERHAAQNVGNTTVHVLNIELREPAGKAAAKVPASRDPVKVSPRIYKVLLNNKRVRVLDIRLNPGGKSPMHAHPAYIVYALTDGKVKFTMPGGKTRTASLKKGQALWSEAETHAAQNVGKTTIHVLNIELKGARPGKMQPTAAKAR